jgi:hypothetical protein
VRTLNESTICLSFVRSSSLEPRQSEKGRKIGNYYEISAHLTRNGFLSPSLVVCVPSFSPSEPIWSRSHDQIWLSAAAAAETRKRSLRRGDRFIVNYFIELAERLVFDVSLASSPRCVLVLRALGE